MKESRKPLFLKAFAVAAAVILGGAAFYATVTHYHLIQPDEPEAAFNDTLPAVPHVTAALPASTAAVEDPASEEEVATPPTLEFLYVDVAARVSDADGAAVAIKVRGRAPTCTADATPPSDARQTWSAVGSSSSAELELIHHWCIPVKPGSALAYRPFNGDWQFAAGDAGADGAANYLRYVTPGGANAAIKTAALAACDDDKGCGFVATASVGADDSRIQVSMPTASGPESAWINSDDDSSQPVTATESDPTTWTGYRLTSPSIRTGFQ